MILIPGKHPRVQMDPEAYQKLCLEVLKRDGWRCQQCGSQTNLQVHHIHSRSQGGDDLETNLITLCSECHIAVHATQRR